MNTNEAKKWKVNNNPLVNDHNQKEPEIFQHKVTQSKKITKGEKYIYIFFSIILIVMSTYIVSYSAKTDTMNRELQSFEETVADQKFVNEGLTFEIKELSQPERITKIAKSKGLKIQDAQVKKANKVQD